MTNSHSPIHFKNFIMATIYTMPHPQSSGNLKIQFDNGGECAILVA